MTPVADSEARLYGTEGYALESPQGDLGWIEEVLVGDENMPAALAVRTIEGWHGLLLGEDVLAVDRDYHWIVVPAEPALLELGTPRLVSAGDGGEGRLAAWWSTTGKVRRPVPRRPKPIPLPFRRLLPRLAPSTGDPRLWKAVAALVTFIAVLVLVVVVLAFLVARAVTGAAY